MLEALKQDREVHVDELPYEYQRDDLFARAFTMLFGKVPDPALLNLPPDAILVLLALTGACAGTLMDHPEIAPLDAAQETLGFIFADSPQGIAAHGLRLDPTATTPTAQPLTLVTPMDPTLIGNEMFVTSTMGGEVEVPGEPASRSLWIEMRGHWLSDALANPAGPFTTHHQGVHLPAGSMATDIARAFHWVVKLASDRDRLDKLKIWTIGPTGTPIPPR